MASSAQNARLNRTGARERKELPAPDSALLIGTSVVTFRRLIIGLYLLLFLVIGAASGLYFWDTREEYERLRKLQLASEQRLAEAEARLQEQEKTLERLRTDPVYVEKVIRKRLGYAKPDEYNFRFPD